MRVRKRMSASPHPTTEKPVAECGKFQIPKPINTGDVRTIVHMEHRTLLSSHGIDLDVRDKKQFIMDLIQEICPFRSLYLAYINAQLCVMGRLAAIQMFTLF